MGVELFEIADLHHLSQIAEGFVVVALALGHAPGLGGGFPAGDGAAGFHAAADLRRDAETDATLAHFIKAHGVEATALHVGLVGLEGADLIDREGEVAIPFEGVEAEIEVDVEDQIHSLGAGNRVEKGSNCG